MACVWPSGLEAWTDSETGCSSCSGNTEGPSLRATGGQTGATPEGRAAPHPLPTLTWTPSILQKAREGKGQGLCELCAFCCFSAPGPFSEVACLSAGVKLDQEALCGLLLLAPGTTVCSDQPPRTLCRSHRPTASCLMSDRLPNSQLRIPLPNVS